MDGISTVSNACDNNLAQPIGYREYVGLLTLAIYLHCISCQTVGRPTIAAIHKISNVLQVLANH